MPAKSKFNRHLIDFLCVMLRYYRFSFPFVSLYFLFFLSIFYVYFYRSAESTEILWRRMLCSYTRVYNIAYILVYGIEREIPFVNS